MQCKEFLLLSGFRNNISPFIRIQEQHSVINVLTPFRE
jgi:hypothetical protein